MLDIIRPPLSEERAAELAGYLRVMWERAEGSRRTQVDSLYLKWNQHYHAQPKEKERSFPWPKASNVVVPLSRMYVDMLAARTLNVIMATQPLFKLKGYPPDLRDAVEAFLNRKAIYTWKLYPIFREVLRRGAKNGTVVAKTIFHEKARRFVSNQQGPEDFTFSEPMTRLIPFDDIYMYPITAEYQCDLDIIFHRVRYSERQAMERGAPGAGDWNLTDAEISSLVETSADIARAKDLEESGLDLSDGKDLKLLECHLDYRLDGVHSYPLVALLEPKTGKLVDYYHNPYPPSIKIFNLYVPFPKENMIYGESLCQLLSDFMEEATSIHNERRNNSYVASAPLFKRKKGSYLPNPSTNWYPGKVFDVENMDDFDVLNVGRTHPDMIQEENQVFALADKLVGVGPLMMGGASGGQDKRGVYNTGGILALLAEGNHRQNTHIRDAREALSNIGLAQWMVYAKYGEPGTDEDLDEFPPEIRSNILAGIETARDKRHQRFEVASSTSFYNSEVEKQNLMQMIQLVGQYGSAAQQMVPLLADPKLNPALRMVLNDLNNLHRWMVRRILRAYEEYDAEELLPDVRIAIESAVPGGSRGTKEAGGGGGAGVSAPGGAPSAPGMAQAPGIAELLQMVEGPGAGENGAGY